jgi:hypothetical protein
MTTMATRMATMMATTMAADDDNIEVDGDGATGDNDGDGVTGANALWRDGI